MGLNRADVNLSNKNHQEVLIALKQLLKELQKITQQLEYLTGEESHNE